MKELREQFEKDYPNADWGVSITWRVYAEWLEKKCEELQAKLFRLTTSSEFVEQKLSEKQPQQTWYKDEDGNYYESKESYNRAKACSTCLFGQKQPNAACISCNTFKENGNWKPLNK